MIQTVHGNVYGDGAVKIRCRIMPLIWIDLWEYEQNISMVSLRTALFVPTFLIFCVLSSCDLCIRCGARVRALLCICICVYANLCVCAGWSDGRSVGCFALPLLITFWLLVRLAAAWMRCKCERQRIETNTRHTKAPICIRLCAIAICLLCFSSYLLNWDSRE